MNPARFPTRKGFTLAEVMVTTLLITLVMLPIIRMSYLVIRNTQYARDAGEALALGQAELEAMAGMDYDDIVSGVLQKDSYTITWTVAEESGMKTVRMKIEWEIPGSEQKVELNTVFSDDLDQTYTLP